MGIYSWSSINAHFKALVRASQGRVIPEGAGLCAEPVCTTLHGFPQEAPRSPCRPGGDVSGDPGLPGSRVQADQNHAWSVVFPVWPEGPQAAGLEIRISEALALEGCPKAR